MRGAEAVEVILGKGGEIARVGDVQDPFGAGRIGRVPQRGGLARAGMAFEKPHRLTGRRKPRLRLSPGQRRVFFAPQIANGHGHVMGVE